MKGYPYAYQENGGYFSYVFFFLMSYFPEVIQDGARGAKMEMWLHYDTQNDGGIEREGLRLYQCKKKHRNWIRYC